MTLRQTLDILVLLNSLKVQPKYYKQISKLLASEATTENIRNASLLLDNIELNLDNEKFSKVHNDRI